MKKILSVLLLSLVVMISSISVYAEDAGWECPNCGIEAVGNFCSNCGEAKPEWKCPTCGEVMTGKFCSNCGTQKPAEEKTEGYKKMEGVGFDSPEAALGAYINGLKNNDIDQMLSAFAIETYAKNYSVQKFVERVKMFSPSVNYVPVISDFSERLNIETRRAEIMTLIHNNYLALEKSKIVFGANTMSNINMDQYESEEELVNDIFLTDDSIVLKSIDFKNEFIDPAELTDKYDTEANQKVMMNHIYTYGGEDAASTAAVLYCNGEAFLLMADAVKYDGKWYLDYLGGNISSLLNFNYALAGMVPLGSESADNIGELFG